MSNPHTLNILIVDDHPNNLFTLHTLIEEHIEATIIEAESGEDALQILLQQAIDLIILDVQMPVMDGFETAQMIRSRKKTQHIPIVFLTAAYKSEQFKQKGFEIGAADYLTKPIDANQLINRIQSYLRFIFQERQHHQQLEQKVQERTTELVASNRQLQAEIIERQQIETQLQQARDELELRVKERTAELTQINQQLHHEINERKQIEAALQQAKETAETAQAVAETANLAKSQFLANMSHELRTPLNAIIGYSEMLTEEAEDIGQEDFIPDLKKIYTAGNHLLGLINDVLDLSKIEAGKMDLHLEHFDLNKAVNEVLSTVETLIQQKNNTLEIQCNEALGNIYADMLKFRQILFNLLSNAAKFTEGGLICISLNRFRETNEEWIQICVTDDGIGMTPKQQQKLFKPFTQADYSTTRKYGGTGLGLAITKEFVEMMGGTIHLVSEFGHGSLFTITLPVLVTPLEVQQQVELLLNNDSIVLVIDNDSTIRNLFKTDLTKLGYAVAVAATGKEGLKLAKKLRPDTIILDVKIPDIDGWKVLSILKNDNLLADIPVIIVSVEDVREKGMSLGAAEYLLKPINHQQLVNILNKYQVSKETSNLAMIIEDEPITREIMAERLKNQGWRVFKVENGKVALEHLDHKKPALILLDLNMPIMNGFEFLAHLRADDKWATLPVIILTSTHLTTEQQTDLQNNHVESILQKETDNQNELLIKFNQIISSYQYNNKNKKLQYSQ